MSLRDPIQIPELAPAEAQYLAATQPSGFGEYLGAKVQTGFDYSIAGRATDALTGPSERFGPLPSDTARDDAAAMGFAVEQRRITEDEWRKLRLDRPGLEFSGGGTVEYETARTRAFDERRYRDSIIERYQGGLPGQVAGFGAALVGGLATPENFIPFVGPGVRAAMVTRMGVIGGRVGAGALDATIGTAIADAVVLPDLARRGEDVGAADFALDLALGAVTGGLFGAGAGVLARRADTRARQDMLAEAARAVRLDGLQQQADALEVAQRALADDQPVDVGPVLAQALPAIQERYIRAYHGSPHRFDRFSLEHIGKGEGAQAFGHGLYFAESSGVAKSYQEKLGSDGKADSALWAMQESNAKTPQEAADWIDQYLADAEVPVTRTERADLVSARDRLRGGLMPEDGGALYTVDLKVEPDDLLDWDAPLSEQPEKVRKALEGLKPESMGLRGEPTKYGTQYYTPNGAMFGPPTEKADASLVDLASGDGGSLYQKLSDAFGGGQAVADRLRAAGIPGIRYLDGGSRADGEGTRNFVLFDDELVRIREINGKAVESAPEPHPSIIEAEASVGRAPPATGVEEAQRLAKDMGVEDPPELQDIAVMKRGGLLSAADEAELDRAAETVKEADGWATAYETLATCSLRYGA